MQEYLLLQNRTKILLGTYNFLHIRSYSRKTCFLKELGFISLSVHNINNISKRQLLITKLEY